MLHRTTSWLRPCISARARGPVATQADLHWAWNHLDSIDLEVFWVFAWDTWDHGTAVAAMDKTPLEKALSASAVLPSPASWRLAVWPWPKMDFDMLWPFKIQNQKNMEEHGRKDPNLSNVWFVWYLIDAPFTHPTIPSCFRMSKKQMCECALACSTQQEASSDTSRPHNLFPSTLRPWPESRLLLPSASGYRKRRRLATRPHLHRHITWTPRSVQGYQKTDLKGKLGFGNKTGRHVDKQTVWFVEEKCCTVTSAGN